MPKEIIPEEIISEYLTAFARRNPLYPLPDIIFRPHPKRRGWFSVIQGEITETWTVGEFQVINEKLQDEIKKNQNGFFSAFADGVRRNATKLHPNER